MIRHATLLLATLAITTGTANAMLLDGSGVVTDWSVTPLMTTGSVTGVTAGRHFTLNNDYAPIDYPSVGRVPSPGGSTGERFDLEEMHVRVTPNTAQVLVVLSGGLSENAAGTDWLLGDLFFEADGTRYAVATQDAGRTNVSAGDVYRIDSAADTRVLQDASRGYLNNTNLRANDFGPDDTVANVAGPWMIDDAIDAGQLMGSATLDTAMFDYGGDEDGTRLMEYTIDLTALGGMFSDFTAHLAWGCGNDVIRVSGTNVTPVPEPASLALLAMGAAAVVRRR